MRKQRLTLLLALILLGFNGCGQKVVYIKTKCPKLQTKYVKPITIKYEVRNARAAN